MAVETITTEGDFVIKNGEGHDLVRVHCGEDAMSFSILGTAHSTFTLEEAAELRGWIDRRLTEAV